MKILMSFDFFSIILVMQLYFILNKHTDYKHVRCVITQ